MNRLGYGQSAWHTTRYDELGFTAYVTEQLGGSLAALAPTGSNSTAKLQRAIDSRRQLEAMLLDFWFNHFNVDNSSGLIRRTVGQHEAAIRRHILGDFGDMLLATAKSPAMLDYLDNRVNFEYREQGGRTYGPNENYARELMELHTLGVDGGYVEADIIEVARVLTGWSVESDAYKFKQFRHDDGPKTVLGATFPAGRNEEEGVELLAMLANHGSTASFLSRKLCRRLVSENPPASAVDAGAAAFSASGGDLAKTVQAIVSDEGFKGDAGFRSKVKPPHRYLASAVLAMGVVWKGQYEGILDDLVDGIELLGEEPYKVAPPTGYPEASGYWISSSAMLDRFRLAGRIAAHPNLRDRLKLVSGATGGGGAAATVDKVAASICPGGISAQTRTAAEAFVRGNANTNNERVRDAAHAILSSPEFVRF